MKHFGINYVIAKLVKRSYSYQQFACLAFAMLLPAISGKRHSVFKLSMHVCIDLSVRDQY